ncbi:hypothetical protein PRIPAC_95950 [Pristionchus pacificus]|uniref:Uncharacterized protein n=1 Tax=Pristionchus pacificus TaxID=54126 RepID=A0A2A6D1A0_PRIPA|nr:hypothetical protein PRIPAC_95950 [Pristionchus pacificus]|eukprot:PDM84087.1 hypothetical protein PRIPAC_34279 [Pristionchus pacificus]
MKNLLFLLPISLQAFSLGGRPMWAKPDSEPFEVVTIVFTSFRYGNVTEDPTTTVFSRSSEGIRIPLTPLSTKEEKIYNGTSLYTPTDPLTKDQKEKARRIVAKINSALETMPTSASSMHHKSPLLDKTKVPLF